MSDPYQSAPDNPFQPPSPATAPPTAPLDTPVTGYGASFGEPTYSGTAETGSSGSSSGTAGKAGEAAKQAGAAASDVASGAKERASDVASTATEHAAAVAGTAQEKGKEVLGEAKTQAQSLLGQVREQLSQQTQQGHQSAHQGLSSIADELSAMIDGRGAQGGPASQLAEQARDRVNEIARWLEQRQPGDLVEEARNFARRRPGTFLVGALLAGVAVGRLTRGAVDAHRDSGSSTDLVPGDTYAGVHYGSGTTGYAGTGSYGQEGLYGGSTDTVVTSGYPSGSTGSGYGTGYPPGAALDQQSVDLPQETRIDGLLGSEPSVGYSAPPTGEVER